ncbi:MAG: response regulator [Chloroflexi bacterium]|nr:response regulator [Chloroflexota bacterium]
MATTILVVDDDVDSLKLISLMLQRQGHDVISADSGGRAIEKASAEQPDLIILDVMMPDMDGYQVCRQLRSEARTRDIPIIMFTAKTLIDDKVAGFEAGADDYLTKPTHPAELASRVKAVLARSIARKKESGGDGAEQTAVIALLGTKGGVGTSTLGINIGALLATREKTTIADFRLGQGTLGLSLGQVKSTGLANLLSLPPNEITPQKVESELVAHKSGLQLLLSTTRPRENQINLSQDAAVLILRHLRSLSTNVIVDLGSGLNRFSARMVREVDHVIVTIEPSRIALIMARGILQEIKQIGLNPSSISAVIIHRAPSNTHIPWQDAEQILDHEITAMISAVPDLAFEATEAAEPMVLYAPDSILANQHVKLVEELIKRTKGEPA